MGVRTFWLTESPLVERSLRRYVSGATGNTCPGVYGYHNAYVVIARVEKAPGPNRYETVAPHPAEYVNDARWPTKCAGCGYVFHRDDEWQVNDDRLYAGWPNGELYTLRNAPPGAMWDAWWLKQFWAADDGICLVVICPDGKEWQVDGPSKQHPNTKAWSRTGDPRLAQVTALPSIDTGTYHGYLRNGEFSEPL